MQKRELSLKLRSLAVAIVAAAGMAVGGAGQVPRLEFVSQLGGTCRAVSAEGDRVYLAQGPRLIVLEATDPARLIEVRRSLPLPSAIEGMFVADGYAYLADDLHGLRILSLQDPANPIEVGRLPSLDASLAVWVEGGFAYVAERYGGLAVVSIEDKANPRRVGVWDTPGRAVGLAVAGGYAYIADGREGVRVVSVVDPTHPVEVASVPTTGSAVRLAVSDGHLYVADAGFGLRILSVADPKRPVEVGALPGGQVQDVAVGGDFASVAVGDLGVQAASLSDRASPSWLNPIPMAGGGQAAYVQGGYLYVASRTGGLHVLSLADPAKPDLVGTFGAWAMDAQRVAMAGDLVLVSDPDKGVLIVSLVDPADPQGLAWAAVPAATIAVANRLAYVVGGTTLTVLDLSNPGTPAAIGSLGLPGMAEAIRVQDDYAYVACTRAGIALVSVADPTDPQLISSLPEVGYARDIHVAGSLVFVAAWADGLRVVSVGDSTQPAVVGAWTDGQPVERVE